MEALRHRVIDSGPEWEEARAAFERAEAERAIWIQMWPELRENYPRQFVARIGKSVVAVDPDPSALLQRVRAMETDPDDVLVEYIHDGTEKYIL